MTVTVAWDDLENRVLCYNYTGQWTWPEQEEAVTHALELVGAARVPVDVIADFTESFLVPAGAVSNFRLSILRLDRVLPFKTAVLVLRNEFMRQMLVTFTRLYGRGGLGARLYAVKTLEEAHEFLRAQRIGDNSTETPAP